MDEGFAKSFINKRGYIGYTNTIYHKSDFKLYDMAGIGRYSTCVYEGYLQQNFDSAMTLFSIGGFPLAIWILISVLLAPCLLRENKDTAYTPPSNSDLEIAMSGETQSVRVNVTVMHN